MQRHLSLLGLAGLFLALTPQWTPAILDSDANAGSFEQRSGRQQRTGQIIVEVLEISDLSPVVGVRVELVENGRVLRTDANGRVVFRVSAGPHDLRVHDLTGPGPAIRVDAVHADVIAGQAVQIRVLDCGMCL